MAWTQPPEQRFRGSGCEKDPGDPGHAAAPQGPWSLAMACPGALLWTGEPDVTSAKCTETFLNHSVG